MCGVVGVFAFADQRPGELLPAIRALTTLMERRGPDDRGEWTDDRRCALGFQRLAILDLSPLGHQPMVSADGRYVLVFNGEIYNFRELRDELESRGRSFRSTGDSEVLLAALIEWGVAALTRLNGMFAFAFYDALEHRLLLARDHAGIKPLHYACTSQGVVFASQYNQLLAHPWARHLAPDHDGLSLYLRFGFVPAPYGLHRGAHQVEAGQWVEIGSDGSIRRGRFFDPSPSQSPSLTGAEALEEFEGTFARAIRRHLTSDVPVGVLLSGGVDSPLVAAEAARHARGMKAFTIEVDDPAYNEANDAAAYARELGLKHVVEQVRTDDALSLVGEVAAACTEPTGDSSIFPMLIVSRLVRRHAKVVLSGDGGDELFWGYPHRFGGAISQAHYFGWPRPARALAVGARRILNRGRATREVLRHDSVGEYYQRKHTLLHEDDLARVFPGLHGIPADFRAFAFDGTDAGSAARWVRWNEFRLHLARVLQKVDRASMHHSLEVRVPLLDREVVELAWRIDWKTCLDLDKRIGKRVLRQALARRVQYQTVPKRGFSVPMPQWLSGPLRPLLHDLVMNRRELLGLELDKRALAELEARVVAGDKSKAGGLWLLLSLALWSRTHLEGRVT